MATVFQKKTSVPNFLARNRNKKYITIYFHRSTCHMFWSRHKLGQDDIIVHISTWLCFLCLGWLWTLSTTIRREGQVHLSQNVTDSIADTFISTFIHPGKICQYYSSWGRVEEAGWFGYSLWRADWVFPPDCFTNLHNFLSIWQATILDSNDDLAILNFDANQGPSWISV